MSPPDIAKASKEVRQHMQPKHRVWNSCLAPGRKIGPFFTWRG